MQRLALECWALGVDAICWAYKAGNSAGPWKQALLHTLGDTTRSNGRCDNNCAGVLVPCMTGGERECVREVPVCGSLVHIPHHSSEKQDERVYGAVHIGNGICCPTDVVFVSLTGAKICAQATRQQCKRLCSHFRC